MTMKKLASHIAALEGKKHEASIGDVREIIKLISIACASDPQVVSALIKNGAKLMKSERTKQ